MRFPRASAVIVALSTFVAVVTVASLVSQIAPLDRAGAVLPDGPIVTTGQPVDESLADETVDDAAPTAEGVAPGSSSSGNADQVSTGGGTTVVDPAPAEPVISGPNIPPTAGNSGNTPGQPESPGNSDNAPGQSKP